jgi:hypothetical protein
MKYFLLTGGFIGFLLVLVSGVYAGHSSVVVLRDACVASIVGGLLFRILHSAFASGIRAHLMDRAQTKVESDPEAEESESRPRSRRRRP